MRNVDLSPLYRSFIGFDHLATMLDAASRSEKQSGYPPYNIESLSEEKYRITMAIAGFAENEVDIEVEGNSLVIVGRKTDKQDDTKFVYKGISERDFERKFQLSDHVKVVGATLENGLLHVDLEREIPEAMKPRKIAIGNSKVIDSK